MAIESSTEDGGATCLCAGSSEHREIIIVSLQTLAGTSSLIVEGRVTHYLQQLNSWIKITFICFVRITYSVSILFIPRDKGTARWKVRNTLVYNRNQRIKHYRFSNKLTNN